MRGCEGSAKEFCRSRPAGACPKNKNTDKNESSVAVPRRCSSNEYAVPRRFSSCVCVCVCVSFHRPPLPLQSPVCISEGARMNTDTCTEKEKATDTERILEIETKCHQNSASANAKEN